MICKIYFGKIFYKNILSFVFILVIKEYFVGCILGLMVWKFDWIKRLKELLIICCV